MQIGRANGALSFHRADKVIDFNNGIMGGESSRSLRVQRDQAFFKKQTLDNAQMRKSAMTAPSPKQQMLCAERMRALSVL